MDYKAKYLKYKQKYLNLHYELYGGSFRVSDAIQKEKDEIIPKLNSIITNMTSLVEAIDETIGNKRTFHLIENQQIQRRKHKVNLLVKSKDNLLLLLYYFGIDYTTNIFDDVAPVHITENIFDIRERIHKKLRYINKFIKQFNKTDDNLEQQKGINEIILIIITNIEEIQKFYNNFGKRYKNLKL
jgi:hypothetical protein